MCGIRLRWRGFAQADAAVSAIEFSLIFPFLLFMLLAGAQVIQYVNALRKVEAIATSISSMISQAKPLTPALTIATVNSTDINFSYDSALLIYPYVMYDAKLKNIPWRKDITVSYASIGFTQLSTLCAGLTDMSACYAATVMWTSTGTSTSSYRPCLLPQTPVANNAPYNRFNLPRSLYGPGTIIAIDVTFQFVPTFGSSLIGPITITRSAFVQPRYALQINFDPTGSDGSASSCI